MIEFYIVISICVSNCLFLLYYYYVKNKLEKDFNKLMIDFNEESINFENSAFLEDFELISTEKDNIFENINF